MSSAFYQQIQTQIEVKEEGLYKSERIITSAQKAAVSISTGEEVLNFCANNFTRALLTTLTLSKLLKTVWINTVLSMASVRFICGTQDSHKELEQKLSTFLGKEDTILYTSCFDANAGYSKRF